MQKDNIIRLIASGLFLWCLLGCKVGPDFEEPTLYSNEQIEKALDLKPNKTNNSYLIFNDDVLNKLLGMAIENSPVVRSAIQKVKQARLSVQVEQVKGLPTLDAMGQYQYVKESRNIGYVFNEDVYQVGLDASWEIDIFGGVRRRTEAALANAYMTIANLDNVYVSLTAQVALAYLQLRYGQSMKSLLKENLKTQKEVLSDTQSLFHAGLTSQDKVNQAKISVQNIQSEIADVEIQTQQSENQLALLTGKLPADLGDLLSPQNQSLVDKAFAFDVNRFFELSANVISERPDVKASLYQLKVQNANVGVAVADLYPKISLSAMLGFQSLHSDKLFNHKSYAYSLTPGFSIPLFYFGQLKNQVEIEKSKYAELFAEYENTFLTAAEEIKNVLVSIQGVQKQYDAATNTLSETENTYQLSKQKRSAGLINQIDLDQAKIQLLSARQKWIKTNTKLYEDVIRFFKAVGIVS